jgi:poly-gamma-glutamate synthesis protein (capsule biosynthesis protein)
MPRVTRKGRIAAVVRLALAASGCLTGLRAAAEPIETIDIRAVGDAGYVGGTGTFQKPPKAWVERHLDAFAELRSSDVNFLNFEASLVRDCQRFEDKTFGFASAPEALAQFGQWGFNLASLANNHALDCTDPPAHHEHDAVMAIVKKLAPDLQTHGVARRVGGLATGFARLEVRGIKIGMAAIKAWDNGGRAPIGSLGNRHAIMAALQKEPVDVRILSVHGGIEGTRRPTATMMDVAREFISRYDGDIVFAHHPHRWQGFELLTKANGKHAIIFYSLGNFLHNGLSPSGDGLMARVAVARDGIDVESVALVPLAAANVRPGPIKERELRPFALELQQSNATIARHPLPEGLARVPFTLDFMQLPAPGVRVVPTGTMTPFAKR